MCAPESFRVMFSNLSRPSPTLWCSEHNHGPSRSECFARATSFLLEFTDLGDAALHCCSHCLMHGRQVAALDEVWCPSVPNKECFELLVADARENCRVVDLCWISSAIEIKLDADIPYSR